MPESLPLLQRIDPDSVPAESGRPDPGKVLSGDPVHTTWSHHEAGGLYCGLWQSTPGSWTINYTEWEYFRIRDGVSRLTDANGHVTELRAGDAFILRPGFQGIWTVIETTLKDYVILT